MGGVGGGNGGLPALRNGGRGGVEAFEREFGRRGRGRGRGGGGGGRGIGKGIGGGGLQQQGQQVQQRQEGQQQQQQQHGAVGGLDAFAAGGSVQYGSGGMAGAMNSHSPVQSALHSSSSPRQNVLNPTSPLPPNGGQLLPSRYHQGHERQQQQPHHQQQQQLQHGSHGGIGSYNGGVGVSAGYYGGAQQQTQQPQQPQQQRVHMQQQQQHRQQQPQVQESHLRQQQLHHHQQHQQHQQQQSYGVNAFGGNAQVTSQAAYVPSSFALTTPEEDALVRKRFVEMVVAEKLPMGFIHGLGMKTLCRAMKIRDAQIPSIDEMCGPLLQNIKDDAMRRVESVSRRMKGLGVAVCQVGNVGMELFAVVASGLVDGDYVSCCLGCVSEEDGERESGESRMNGGDGEMEEAEWLQGKKKLLRAVVRTLREWRVYEKCEALTMVVEEYYGGKNIRKLELELRNDIIFLPCFAHGVKMIYDNLILKDVWYKSFLGRIRKVIRHVLENPVNFAVAVKSEEAEREREGLGRGEPVDDEARKLIVDEEDGSNVEKTLIMTERVLANYNAIKQVLEQVEMKSDVDEEETKGNDDNEASAAKSGNGKAEKQEKMEVESGAVNGEKIVDEQEKGGDEIQKAIPSTGNNDVKEAEKTWSPFPSRALVDIVQNVLRMILEANRIFSRRGTQGTVSSAIPVVKGLCKIIMKSQDNCMEGMEPLFAKVQDRLSKQHSLLEGDDTYAIATLLDPRFKSRVFESIASADRAQRSLVNVCLNYKTALSSQRNPGANGIMMLSAMQSTVNEETHERENRIGSREYPKTDLDRMIATYVAEEVEPFNKSVSEYWKEQRGRFPLLSQVAQLYIALPAAAVIDRSGDDGYGKEEREARSVSYLGMEDGEVECLRYNLRSDIMQSR